MFKKRKAIKEGLKVLEENKKRSRKRMKKLYNHLAREREKRVLSWSFDRSIMKRDDHIVIEVFHGNKVAIKKINVLDIPHGMLDETVRRAEQETAYHLADEILNNN